MKKDGALMTYAVWVRASKPYERIHGKPSKCHRTLCKHWTHSFMLFTEVKNLTFNFVFSSFNRSSHIFLVSLYFFDMPRNLRLFTSTKPNINFDFIGLGFFSANLCEAGTWRWTYYCESISLQSNDLQVSWELVI